MKLNLTIEELDFILHTLMKKLKDDSEKNINVANRQHEIITMFIKSFDAFYDEAYTFPESQRNEIRCEIDPWLIIDG